MILLNPLLDLFENKTLNLIINKINYYSNDGDDVVKDKTFSDTHLIIGTVYQV